jgi:hypothetical protein
VHNKLLNIETRLAQGVKMKNAALVFCANLQFVTANPGFSSFRHRRAMP